MRTVILSGGDFGGEVVEIDESVTEIVRQNDDWLFGYEVRKGRQAICARVVNKRAEEEEL
jgi:hypothetical protein